MQPDQEKVRIRTENMKLCAAFWQCCNSALHTAVPWLCRRRAAQPLGGKRKRAVRPAAGHPSSSDRESSPEFESAEDQVFGATDAR